jgi:hypothetical protein
MGMVEIFQMLADAAFVHATQFAVDAIQIRKNDEAHTHRGNRQRVYESHHGVTTPSRFRNRRSKRSISP